MEEINLGDRVKIDDKTTGVVVAVSPSVYQVVVDGYDYSDNPAYPYHNISKERCKKIN